MKEEATNGDDFSVCGDIKTKVSCWIKRNAESVTYSTMPTTRNGKWKRKGHEASRWCRSNVTWTVEEVTFALSSRGCHTEVGDYSIKKSGIIGCIFYLLGT